MNIKTFTYNLLESKIVSDDATLLCFKFDSFPSDNEIKNKFLKHFNLSVAFDEFIDSIDANSLLNEENDILFIVMMKFFRIGFGSPAMSQLFNQYPNLFEKAKAKTTIGLDNLRSFASVYRTMPFSNSEMFLAACGDPCKPVNEARFDNIPKSGEVLRYLPIYTPIPDPYFSSKIKAEYRCFLSYSSDSRHISFLRSISSLQDFSFSKLDLDNEAHRRVLGALPSIIGKRTIYENFISSSIVSFFAERFRCDLDAVCALPTVKDFIEYYLLEFSNTSAAHIHYEHWSSDAGQGEVLSAAF